MYIYLSIKITLELAQPMTPYLFCAWCYKVVWSLDKWIAGQDPLCCSGPLGITVTEGMRRVFRLWFSCWISSSCFSYIFTAWVNRMIPKSKWNIPGIKYLLLMRWFRKKYLTIHFQKNLKLNYYWFYHFLISLNSDPQCSHLMICCYKDLILVATYH